MSENMPERRRLRFWLLLFFLALALPTAFLIRQAYSDLKWEAFHQHRLLAEELGQRIDGQVRRLVEAEEARTFSDYAFLNVAGDPGANFLQRSPLSTFPVEVAIPGLIGYFQVDAAGEFSTPLLPVGGAQVAVYGISGAEHGARMALEQSIAKILIENRLVQADSEEGVDEVAEQKVAGDDRRSKTDADSSLMLEERAAAAPLEQAVSQAGFDRLSPEDDLGAPQRKQKVVGQLGAVDDLRLDDRFQNRSLESAASAVASHSASTLKKGVRRERSILPEPQRVAEDESAAPFRPQSIQVRTFESEIDPFELSLLDSGHFVLFRKVWRDGQRTIQGVLLAQQLFLSGIVESHFSNTALSRMSDLLVAYRGNVFSTFSGRRSRDYFSDTQELGDALLYQTPLSAPLGEVELIFTLRHLPAGPGAVVVSWLTGILMMVLCGGFLLMYRVGLRQIELARQQQDFVSAVSHELKTPLTSIRMYSEMLREGWADEEKRRGYYDYIHGESERLSRLINNVLQLARLNRNAVTADLKAVAVSALMDAVNEKVSSQLERAGFECHLACSAELGQRSVIVDSDYFLQIMINLVDNAVKFAAKGEVRRIDLECRALGEQTALFSVRDYGPGIADHQMRRIFKLFYRAENELTRETVGTGIGLALVHQLAVAQHGKVDVVNRKPGAEFRLTLPIAG